jgi:hypothetical protein
LLIKHRDEFISTRDITVELPLSVVSKKSMEQIARANHGNAEKAAAADPQVPAAKVRGANRPAGKARAKSGGSKKAERKK